MNLVAMDRVGLSLLVCRPLNIWVRVGLLVECQKRVLAAHLLYGWHCFPHPVPSHFGETRDAQGFL
jgi:hypothetical protein